MSDRFKKLEMIKSNANHTRETVEDLEIKLQKLTEEEAPIEEREKLQHRIDQMKKSNSDKDNHDHNEKTHEHHHDHHSIEKGASKFHEQSKKGQKHHKKHD